VEDGETEEVGEAAVVGEDGAVEVVVGVIHTTITITIVAEEEVEGAAGSQGEEVTLEEAAAGFPPAAHQEEAELVLGPGDLLVLEVLADDELLLSYLWSGSVRHGSKDGRLYST